MQDPFEAQGNNATNTTVQFGASFWLVQNIVRCGYLGSAMMTLALPSWEMAVPQMFNSWTQKQE